jgi:hypothetical protein
VGEPRLFRSIEKIDGGSELRAEHELVVARRAAADRGGDQERGYGGENVRAPMSLSARTQLVHRPLTVIGRDVLLRESGDVFVEIRVRGRICSTNTSGRSGRR